MKYSLKIRKEWYITAETFGEGRRFCGVSCLPLDTLFLQGRESQNSHMNSGTLKHGVSLARERGSCHIQQLTSVPSEAFLPVRHLSFPLLHHIKVEGGNLNFCWRLTEISQIRVIQLVFQCFSGKETGVKSIQSKIQHNAPTINLWIYHYCYHQVIL